MGVDLSNEVVITGVGMVSPVGIGREAFWSSLKNGASGVRVREPFDDVHSPLHLASPVEDFEPRKLIPNRKALKVMCREIQLGCAASALAVEDAGLDPSTIDPDRMGVITGAESFYCEPGDLRDVYVRYESTNGGKSPDESIDYGIWIEAALRETQPLWMLKYLPNMVSCQIAIAIDARGPNNSIFQGEASSLLAVAEASELIRRGVADVMIVGGSGSRMNIVGMMYKGVDDLCSGIEDPASALRPLDRDRRGTVAGESAGMLVLESAGFAASRSAKVLARLAATSSVCETIQSDKADAVCRSMNVACDKAGFDSVGTIYAMADGRTENDALEVAGIAKFCEVTANDGDDTKVTAVSGAYGNTGTGNASLCLAAAVLGLSESVVPPTQNFEQADAGRQLNVVHGECAEQSRPQSLVVANSYNGQAAAVAIERV